MCIRDRDINPDFTMSINLSYLQVVEPSFAAFFRNVLEEMKVPCRNIVVELCIRDRRNIMPQIGNNLIINIKDTCVLSVIGTVELFYTTKGVAGAFYTYFEAFTIAMVRYFVLTFTCSRILRYWEKRMDGPEAYDLATTDTLAYTLSLIHI